MIGDKGPLTEEVVVVVVVVVGKDEKVRAVRGGEVMVRIAGRELM